MCHSVAFAIYMKTYLKAKKTELWWKLKYFIMQKKIL